MCRVIASISGAPADYGVDESKLRPFDRLLQSLEGKLMEGKIFEVTEKNPYVTHKIDLFAAQYWWFTESGTHLLQMFALIDARLLFTITHWNRPLLFLPLSLSSVLYRNVKHKIVTTSPYKSGTSQTGHYYIQPVCDMWFFVDRNVSILCVTCMGFIFCHLEYFSLHQFSPPVTVEQWLSKGLSLLSSTP